MRYGTSVVTRLSRDEYAGLCRLRQLPRSQEAPCHAEMYSMTEQGNGTVIVRVWVSTLEAMSEDEAERVLRETIVEAMALA